VRFEIDDQQVLDRHGFWAELVKLRADGECEDASPDDPCSGRLESHHVAFNGQEGDHRLANGACLCTRHHKARHAARNAERRGRRLAGGWKPLRDLFPRVVVRWSAPELRLPTTMADEVRLVAMMCSRPSWT
jgi:hypothetical protein